jgi:hypothetical protein
MCAATPIVADDAAEALREPPEVLAFQCERTIPADVLDHGHGCGRRTAGTLRRDGRRRERRRRMVAMMRPGRMRTSSASGHGQSFAVRNVCVARRGVHSVMERDMRVRALLLTTSNQ